MSCINPKYFYTNSHFLSSEHYKPFLIGAPCGKCCECNKQKRMSWSVRAYYEALECFNKHKGFVVFDTLSYSDDKVPYFHDHNKKALLTCYDKMCFNRNHVRLFFQKLRRRLEWHGYDVRNRLKYFLTSEFGEKEYYRDWLGRVRKGTHRPHYHVLFFVNFEIDPCVFSKYVSDCWEFGITDGVEYKGEYYFKVKRLFRGEGAHCLSCIRYVAKYVCKDSVYQDVVKWNLGKMFNLLYRSVDWRNNLNIKEEYNKLLFQVGQFHVESKNFGSYLLEVKNTDDFINDGFVLLPSSENNAFDRVNIPAYYLRKLFYETFWFNGHRYWRINSVGLKYKLNVFRKSVENLALKINSWLERIKIVDDKFYLYCRNKIGDGKILSEYVLGLRGRILPFKSTKLNNVYEILVESNSTDSFNYKQIIDGDICLFPYNHKNDCVRFGGRFVSKEYLGDSTIWQEPWKSDAHIVPSHEFFSKYCYHDHILDDIYQEYLNDQFDAGFKKQLEYDNNKYEKYKLESYGILTH